MESDSVTNVHAETIEVWVPGAFQCATCNVPVQAQDYLMAKEAELRAVDAVLAQIATDRDNSKEERQSLVKARFVSEFSLEQRSLREEQGQAGIVC